MSLVRNIVGVVITVAIGGTVYTVSQTDVINNFANDTGLTQQQAEQYVKNVKDEDLVSYSELGSEYTKDGQGIIDLSVQMDCLNYTYEWESQSLTCDRGKSQLYNIGKDEVALGESYKILGSDSASKTDISNTIALIDKVNANYKLDIMSKILDTNNINENKKSNSYNKAILQAALDSSN